MIGWKEYKIGDICESVSDTYHGKDTKVILINTSDVLEGKILNHQLVDNHDLRGQFKKTFKRNDILYSEIRPANKRYAFINLEKTQHYIASTKLMVLRTNSSIVVPQYLFAYLTSNYVISELQHKAESRSGTFPQITFSAEIAPMKIKLPALEIQKRIIGVLDPIEEKIEANNRINDNLEKQGRLLVKQYGTETTNLVPLFEIMNFDNGFPFQSKTYLEKGRYKIITIKNVTDGKIDTAGTSCIDVLPAKMKSCCKLKIGDVLLSLTGNVGRVGIVCESNLLLNQRVAKINPYNSSLLPYLYFVFRQSAMKDQMISLARGTAQANLSPLETLKINIPFQEETAASLSTILFPLFNQIVQNYKENNVLMELRDYLLPRLLNGQINIEA